MASYIHIGDNNNIAQKVKSILLIGGGAETYTARNIYYGNSEGKAEPGYRRVNTSTWYTSGEQSDGMYDVTELTRESTSSIDYETVASTRDMSVSYIEKYSSTNGAYITTRFSTYNGKITSIRTASRQLATMTAYNSRSGYIFYTSTHITISLYANNIDKITYTMYYTYSTKSAYSNSYSQTYAVNNTTLEVRSMANSSKSYAFIFTGRDQYKIQYGTYQSEYITTSLANDVLNYTRSLRFTITYGDAEIGFTTSTHSGTTYLSLTTGTVYTNTTGTIYHTCSSTYGYSGKSSSTYIPD